jgi:PadR family transcriptional regulator AphA
MTKNVVRTLHWFWPRAESVLYSETKRLAELGLARTDSAPGRRGRPQTVYSITDEGRAALQAWLREAPGRLSLHFESLLRVHLAPYGRKEDLIRALESARAEAEELLRTAIVVGTEFVEGRHQFQDQVHLRAILFDYLWRFGLTTYAWAQGWIERVEEWPDLRLRRRVRSDAIRLIEGALAGAPLATRRDLGKANRRPRLEG